jgi:hypothetical protein
MAEKIYNLKHKYPGNGDPKWFADRLFKKLENETGKKFCCMSSGFSSTSYVKNI